jgi:hypothetical protein
MHGGAMGSKLNVKYWLYSSVVVFAVLSVLAFLVRRIIVFPPYAEVAPAGGEMQSVWVLRMWTFIARAIFSLVFALIFTKGLEGKAGVGEGVRYGLWVGVLVFVPPFFLNLSATEISVWNNLVHCLVGVIQAIICGVAVNMVYTTGQKKLAA